MSRLCRQDAITLHDEASEEEFVKFMQEKLIPYFSKRYKGPTRASRADLKGQSLLQSSRHKFLWITIWDGLPEAVRGSSFEQTRMVHFAETDAMLAQLEAFGKRTTEKLFIQIVSIEVPTNT